MKWALKIYGCALQQFFAVEENLKGEREKRFWLNKFFFYIFCLFHVDDFRNFFLDGHICVEAT